MRSPRKRRLAPGLGCGGDAVDSADTRKYMIAASLEPGGVTPAAAECRPYWAGDGFDLYPALRAGLMNAAAARLLSE